MKTTVLFLCLLFSSSTVFSHSEKKDFEYSIVFGGCFEKDIVSLKINNKSIFDRYKVENKNAIKKGNLSLTQSNKKIHLFYNGEQKTKGKVNFEFYLNINLTVNRQVSKYQIDLRKGKVILFEYCPVENLEGKKQLTFEQLQDQVIIM